MDKNQIKTLALYALNYSYKEISQALKVSVNTIKWRLKTVRIKYPEYWDNARSVRSSYKESKIKLDNVILFSTLIKATGESNKKLGELARYNPRKPPSSDAMNIDRLLNIIEIKMKI